MGLISSLIGLADDIIDTTVGVGMALIGNYYECRKCGEMFITKDDAQRHVNRC